MFKSLWATNKRFKRQNKRKSSGRQVINVSFITLWRYINRQVNLRLIVKLACEFTTSGFIKSNNLEQSSMSRNLFGMSIRENSNWNQRIK